MVKLIETKLGTKHKELLNKLYYSFLLEPCGGILKKWLKGYDMFSANLYVNGCQVDRMIFTPLPPHTPSLILGKCNGKYACSFRSISKHWIFINV